MAFFASIFLPPELEPVPAPGLFSGCVAWFSPLVAPDSRALWVQHSGVVASVAGQKGGERATHFIGVWSRMQDDVFMQRLLLLRLEPVDVQWMLDSIAAGEVCDTAHYSFVNLWHAHRITFSELLAQNSVLTWTHTQEQVEGAHDEQQTEPGWATDDAPLDAHALLAPAPAEFELPPARRSPASQPLEAVKPAAIISFNPQGAVSVSQSGSHALRADLHFVGDSFSSATSSNDHSRGEPELDRGQAEVEDELGWREMRESSPSPAELPGVGLNQYNGQTIEGSGWTVERGEQQGEEGEEPKLDWMELDAEVEDEDEYWSEVHSNSLLEGAFRELVPLQEYKTTRVVLDLIGDTPVELAEHAWEAVDNADGAEEHEPLADIKSTSPPASTQPAIQEKHSALAILTDFASLSRSSRPSNGQALSAPSTSQPPSAAKGRGKLIRSSSVPLAEPNSELFKPASETGLLAFHVPSTASALHQTLTKEEPAVVQEEKPELTNPKQPQPTFAQSATEPSGWYYHIALPTPQTSPSATAFTSSTSPATGGHQHALRISVSAFFDQLGLVLPAVEGQSQRDAMAALGAEVNLINTRDKSKFKQVPKKKQSKPVKREAVPLG